MLCPRDGNPLRQVVRDGIAFDLCGRCQGRWLDQGELEQLVLGRTRSGATPAALSSALASAERSGFFRALGSDPGMVCPRCHVPMRKVEFESRGTRITADRCERCKGFWLDKGEMGSLFVFLEEQLPKRMFIWVIGALLGLGLILAWVAAG